MEKLNLHSPDFTQANIEKLTELFPNCVTETRAADGTLKKAIDFDLLKQELSTSIVEDPQERYQLNWPGKREALLTANAPIAKTLKPCRAESVDFNTTQNLYIEGDNLDALKLLQETYLGMVQLPEACDPKSEAYKAGYKTIAEIGKERIRRVGQKVKASVGEALASNSCANKTIAAKIDSAVAAKAAPTGINPTVINPTAIDIGFRVLKVDSSNMKNVYYTPDKLMQGDLEQFTDNIRDDSTPEDLLFQVLLDWGVDLPYPSPKKPLPVLPCCLLMRTPWPLVLTPILTKPLLKNSLPAIPCAWYSVMPALPVIALRSTSSKFLNSFHPPLKLKPCNHGYLENQHEYPANRYRT